MTDIREAKVQNVSQFIPELEVKGSSKGDLLIVGWGGTYGHLLSAYQILAQQFPDRVAFAHFNYINPLPKNTAAIFGQYKSIVVAELNNGQFKTYLQSRLPQYQYLQYNKVEGLPFTVSQLVEHFTTILKS